MSEWRLAGDTQLKMAHSSIKVGSEERNSTRIAEVFQDSQDSHAIYIYTTTLRVQFDTAVKRCHAGVSAAPFGNPESCSSSSA
jgi:hypothetical protein